MSLFQELSQKLLFHHDLNVIAVDWGGGSATMYSTSAANTRLVGLEIAHLIKFLKVQCRSYPLLPIITERENIHRFSIRRFKQIYTHTHPIFHYVG